MDNRTETFSSTYKIILAMAFVIGIIVNMPVWQLALLTLGLLILYMIIVIAIIRWPYFKTEVLGQVMKRAVCAWCPTPLPANDHEAWYLHHWLYHDRTYGSSSVRFYYDGDDLEDVFEK